MSKGAVIWLTGLSGVGKSTLAKALLPHIATPRLHLDGDELREALALLAGGYDPENRLNLALTYARLAKLASDQGQNVVVSTISLFHEVHQWNRANIDDYFEIFLHTSSSILKTRDYKNIYSQGNDNVIGTTIKPQLPLKPDLLIDNSNITVDQTLDIVLNELKQAFRFL
ncbi:MAG: adenylyl-sulfate kinase [Deltaproteobacteria bacterium]|nr:adenylyl-sulfate kinase [Deltaproteobacteria bacterium]